MWEGTTSNGVNLMLPRDNGCVGFGGSFVMFKILLKAEQPVLEL